MGWVLGSPNQVQVPVHIYIYIYFGILARMAHMVVAMGQARRLCTCLAFLARRHQWNCRISQRCPHMKRCMRNKNPQILLGRSQSAPYHIYVLIYNSVGLVVLSSTFPEEDRTPYIYIYIAHLVQASFLLCLLSVTQSAQL